MISKREGQFNTEIKQSDLLNLRLKNNISLRKQSIEDLIFHKRILREDDENNKIEIKSASNEPANEYDLLSLYNSLTKKKYLKENIQSYCDLLKSEDNINILTGLVALRKLLADPVEPPLEEVISNGSALKIIEHLREPSKLNKHILFEAVWILANLASGDSKNTKYICSHGVIDIIETFIPDLGKEFLIDQIIWLIANIAGDKKKYRQKMISKGFLNYLVKVLIDDNFKNILENCLWAISNLLRDICELKVDSITINLSQKCCEIIKTFVLNKLWDNKYTEDSITYCILILSWFSDKFPDIIKFLLKYNLIQYLSQFIDNFDYTSNTLLYIGILRIIGNFSAHDHVTTTEIIDNGILPKLKKILEFEKNFKIRKEVCWILSNIAAGLNKHIELFFSQGGYIDLLFHVAFNDITEVRKEALWCIVNLTSTSKPENFIVLVNKNIFDLLSKWIKNSDYKISSVCIEALTNILDFAFRIQSDIVKHKIYVECESTGLFNKIESLANTSDNKIVSHKSVNFINQYLKKENNLIDDDVFLNNSEITNELNNSLLNEIFDSNKENQMDIEKFNDSSTSLSLENNPLTFTTNYMICSDDETKI